MTKLFVGGLPSDLKDQDLREIFEEYGPILSAKVITDRETRISRGFGFVELENAEKATLAIEELNGGQIDASKIKVSIANPVGSTTGSSSSYSPRGEQNKSGNRSQGYNRDRSPGYDKSKSSRGKYSGGGRNS